MTPLQAKRKANYLDQLRFKIWRGKMLRKILQTDEDWEWFREFDRTINPNR